MNNDEMNERLSALADGQLDAEELAAALAFAVDDENGRATWQLYHLVGAALRSPDLARPADPAFMPRLRAQLAKEALAARPRTLVQAPPMARFSAGRCLPAWPRWRRSGSSAGVRWPRCRAAALRGCQPSHRRLRRRDRWARWPIPRGSS